MSSHTEFQLQIMFQTLDPTTPNKDLYHTPKKSTVTTYKNCLLESDEEMF